MLCYGMESIRKVTVSPYFSLISPPKGRELEGTGQLRWPELWAPGPNKIHVVQEPIQLREEAPEWTLLGPWPSHPQEQGSGPSFCRPCFSQGGRRRGAWWG